MSSAICLHIDQFNILLSGNWLREGEKTLWEKEKMLVTFSQNVFKRPTPQGSLKVGDCVVKS